MPMVVIRAIRCKEGLWLEAIAKSSLFALFLAELPPTATPWVALEVPFSPYVSMAAAGVNTPPPPAPHNLSVTLVTPECLGTEYNSGEPMIQTSRKRLFYMKPSGILGPSLNIVSIPSPVLEARS